MEIKKEVSGLGLTGMILGIVGLILSFVIIGGILGVIGFLLSIIAVSEKGKGHGPAIAGIVCSVIAILLAGFFFMVSRYTTESPEHGQIINESTTQSDTQDSTSISDNTDKDSPDDTNVDDDSVYNIGDEVSFKNWDITVLGTEVTNKIMIDNYVYYKPTEEGNMYYAITLSVTNTGTESDTFLPTYSIGNDTRVKLYFGEYEYTSATFYGLGDDMHDASLNPLSSKTGVIAFSVPEVVASSTEELIFRISCGRDYIDFKVR